ncbi:MAG: type II secretion system F family protein [Planctomycetaceae bacterium]|jgi:type II secretory pathway component PulF|nr:type II secretion system F family protein [Planctomycetaceae bacterium]
MAKFQYKIKKDGSVKTGVINADSLHFASIELRKQGGVILSIRNLPAGESVGGLDTGKHELLRTFMERLFIFSSQIELCLRQLASLLKAGVPILEALSAVGEQAPPLLKKIYSRLAEKVRHGYSMKKSLEEDAACFGEVTIGLIGVGESNGTLDEMFRYSADLMERGRKVRNQIVQAFTYPAIVMVVAMGVGYFLVVHVLPKIIAFISKQSKTVELPMPTKILLWTNDFIWAYGVYLVVLPVFLIAAYFFARKTPSVCERLDYFLLYIPLLGKAYRDHSNTMWCRTLGALLKSGVGVLTALELVEGVMSNRHYAAQFRKVYGMVKQGDSISKGIRNTTLAKFCPMALSMIAVSERSGSLDTSLLHAADYSEEQLSRRVTMLGKFIEPAIFIVIGGIVGFIYFAFFLAMLAATHSAL